MSHYHLAQINVARMRGVNIDDPMMQEFRDNLDVINALAEQSDGFIWRLKDEEGDATSFDPYGDEQIIINMSVWQDVDSLKTYVYNTAHSGFIKRKKEWFHKYGEAHMALWWIPAGDLPSLEQGVAQLKKLQDNGPDKAVFDFKSLQPMPQDL